MNEIQIFRNAAFGEIRICTDDKGNPWFNAVDVCRALDLKNPSQALKTNVDEADVHLMDTKMGSKLRKVNFVDDDDLAKCETKMGSKLRKVNFGDELDVTKTDTKMGKRVQKVNFGDEPDIAKCDTRSGGQVQKVNFADGKCDEIRMTTDETAVFPRGRRMGQNWDDHR